MFKVDPPADETKPYKVVTEDGTVWALCNHPDRANDIALALDLLTVLRSRFTGWLVVLIETARPRR